MIIGAALLRWMYRGGRPNRLARVLNRISAAQFGSGRLAPATWVTLEVTGRRSGRTITCPLVVTVYRGERYVVSMLGGRANWVSNVRAAHGDAVLRRGRREPVHLVEIDAGERAPLASDAATPRHICTFAEELRCSRRPSCDAVMSGSSRMKLWRVVRAMPAAAAVMVVLACGSADSPGPTGSASPALPASGTGSVEIGGRQVTVHVPGSYHPGRLTPLVVALHGYTSSAAELENYLQLTNESEQHGFVYVYPDGSTDDEGNRFWNATDACCAFSGRGPDDSRYLSDLISTIQNSYRIDRARVYLIGHSNGGFMAFRTACDHAGQITAIVSLNGASWNDAARCEPSEPVSVLAVHSSTDETVAFGGGVIGGAAYPSAATTVTQWLRYNRCTPAGRDAPALDLVADLPGAETSVRTYTGGCGGGSTVQAWTINGGTHVPELGHTFASAVTDFMLSRSEPAR